MSYGVCGETRRSVVDQANLQMRTIVLITIGRNPRRSPVPQPDFSPGRLPPEWLKAIRDAKSKVTTSDRIDVARKVEHRAGDTTGRYVHASELRILVAFL